MSKCPNCDGTVVKTGKKGRPRIFCSYECKEAFHGARKAAARAATLVGRTCLVCGSPIEGRNARAQCCSTKCSNRYQNQRKGKRFSEARSAATRAARAGRPCANPECAEVIPIERRADAKFCSNECYRRGQSFRLYKNGWMRQHLYGITPEEYEALLVTQDGRCAICRASEPAGKGGWHVDHCHDSKVIRGLLCHHCNLMLGNAKDNPETLRAAIDYLERAP